MTIQLANPSKAELVAPINEAGVQVSPATEATLQEVVVALGGAPADPLTGRTVTKVIVDQDAAGVSSLGQGVTLHELQGSYNVAAGTLSIISADNADGTGTPTEVWPDMGMLIGSRNPVAMEKDPALRPSAITAAKYLCVKTVTGAFKGVAVVSKEN